MHFCSARVTWFCGHGVLLFMPAVLDKTCILSLPPVRSLYKACSGRPLHCSVSRFANILRICKSVQISVTNVLEPYIYTSQNYKTAGSFSVIRILERNADEYHGFNLFYGPNKVPGEHPKQFRTQLPVCSVVGISPGNGVQASRRRFRQETALLFRTSD